MALLSLEGKILQGNAALHAFLGEEEPALADHAIDAFVSEAIDTLIDRILVQRAHGFGGLAPGDCATLH
jgi:hypothetical protein